MKRTVKKVKILHVPELLPGETLLSHLVRSTLINATYMPNVSSTYFDRLSLKYTFAIPRNLDTFVEATYGILGDADAIIENHTIFPAIRPFISDSQRLANYQAMRSLHDDAPARAIRSWNGTNPDVMKWCLSCVENDENKSAFGIAYWHREHQFVPATRCLIHDTPLECECGCGALYRRPIRTFLPARNCICGREPRVFASLRGLPPGHKLESRIHETLRDLLYNPIPESHYPYVTAALQQGAIDRGFLKMRRLREKLSEYVSTFDTPTFFNATSWLGGSAASISKRLARGQSASDLEFNVEAISVLFATTQDFRHTLDERLRQNRTAEDLWTLGKTNAEKISLRQSHREKLEKGRAKQIRERRTKLDLESATIIRANIEREKNSILRPVRLHKRNMANGCKTQIINNTKAYPVSAQLFAENNETRYQYALRTARWLIEHEAHQYQSESEMVNAIAFTTRVTTDDLKGLVIEVRRSSNGTPEK